MNTQQQQAELYRKAAETIEMCAKHGIEPRCKVMGNEHNVNNVTFQRKHNCYEFPLAVIEGQLVWDDTVVYNQHWINGVPAHACSFTPNNDACWTLKPPKRTVMVELSVEDAEALTHFDITYRNVSESCRRALDNLKDK